MREAAALPLVTITAWEGVFQRAGIKPGNSVLVHGGAGGVSHIAIQLAKHAGAKVYAAVSSEKKAKIARSFGADEVIHYESEDVKSYVNRLTGGKGFDVVFDTVSGGNLPKSFEAAKFNGEVIATVALGQFDLSPVHLKGLSLHVIFMLIPLIHGVNRSAHGATLRDAARLVDEGKLHPLVDPHEFQISDVAEAHRLLESGKAVGKVVLETVW
jgi:NADPH2:quinone reductase